MKLGSQYQSLQNFNELENKNRSIRLNNAKVEYSVVYINKR